MKVYNTLTKKKENFVPVNDNKVNMYVCGITPYNHCHIGHARCYVVFDVVRRYLMHLGYNLEYIQNFTDIDDKIINAANKEKVEPKKYAEKFIKSYFEDMHKLNVLKADYYPRVSENISEIIKFIKTLIDKGFAYQSEEEVYFKITEFKDYGKLSNRNLEEQISGIRVKTDERKQNPLDFSLWKSAKPGEPSWGSPWGKGRPGWHIECSVMSLDRFENTIDIHGGGQDLIFPHHENEIAQSECYLGKPFVKYWLHNGFVTVNKEKMSKSLNNFFLIKDILKKYSPEVLRYFLISVHYRSPLDFSDEHLENAKSGYEKLCNFLITINNTELTESCDTEKISCIIKKFETDFKNAMDDDFNTCNALGVIHSFCNSILKLLNEAGIDSDSKNKVKNIFDSKLEILGLKIVQKKQDNEISDKLMDILIELRNNARKTKDFQTADFIRDELQKIDIELRDSKNKTFYVIN